MSKGVSLHIGVNEVDPNCYSGWSGQLGACEADARVMNRLAKAQGFDTRILLTKRATRRGVLRAMSRAAEQLGNGDIFLLTYAGHGGQVPDVDGDEQDGLDETWRLYDGDLLDDEVCLQYCKFNEGVRILVVSDSCHSGTMTEAPNWTAPSSHASPVAGSTTVAAHGKARGGIGAPGLQTYLRNRAFYDSCDHHLAGNRPLLAATVRLISGCQEDQISLDGKVHGYFTERLLQVWDDGQFEGSYEEFYCEILQRMPAHQRPNHYTIGQPNPHYDLQKPFTI